MSSSVVRLTFRPPAADVPDRATFDSLVRTLFMHRRKTSANALRSLADTRGLEAAAVLRDAHVDPMRRPETLSLGELAAIAARLAAGAPGGVV